MFSNYFNHFLIFIKRLITETYLLLPIKKNNNIDSNLIVSLTSYKPRIKTLHLVIRSLLKQTLLPSKIILYLDNDFQINKLPKKLLRLQKYNFEIKTGYQDIKPHKKYLYVMQEYPDKKIITVDDDLLYDKNLIKDLVKTNILHPDCVCARRVNKITFDKDQNINKYSDWEWSCTDITEPSFSLLATGCGGVLYPPKILPDEAFFIKNIQKYCLETDDIWLKFMELKVNVKVVWTNSRIIHPITIRNTQNNGLFQINTKGQNHNDQNIKKMLNFTGIQLKEYM